MKTVIYVEQDPEGAHTQIIVKTSDRPGLLTDIVHDLKDINVNVLSAEVGSLFYVPSFMFPSPYSCDLLIAFVMLLLPDRLAASILKRTCKTWACL